MKAFLVAGACAFLAALVAVSACSSAELATAKQDAKKALDMACQARALEKASEALDAGKPVPGSLN